MDSQELSRQVAEAMGITPCAFVPNLYAHRPGVECEGEGGCRKPFLYWPDLRDATFREAAIAWLNDRGFRVDTTRESGRCTVYIYTAGLVEVAREFSSAIEEAFGRAFLGAVKVQP